MAIVKIRFKYIPYIDCTKIPQYTLYNRSNDEKTQKKKCRTYEPNISVKLENRIEIKCNVTQELIIDQIVF